MLRSALAILAGLVVIIVTSFGIEAAATPLLLKMFTVALPNEAAMSHNQAVWLFTFAYTLLCVGAAGYVTARLAPHHATRHALILGILQSLLTIPAMLEFRDHAPLWGWILSMVLVIPAAWCGGLLYARRAK
jgi:hypothetical protein